MKKYKCHKVVKAIEMTRAEYNIYRGGSFLKMSAAMMKVIQLSILIHLIKTILIMMDIFRGVLKKFFESGYSEIKGE